MLLSEASSPSQRLTQKSKYAAVASGVALIGALLCVGAFANGTRSTKDGVFTSAQAERGKQIYEKSCKNCHPAEFYTERLQRWDNKSVDALFEAVSTTMPADNVGSLATSEYVDVLSYVFSITGSPAGGTELTADNMDTVKIAAPK
jgi:mono/diheme cytochrome c family protein